MSEVNWFVMSSKPQRELQIVAYLGTKGIETYFPSLRVTPVNPRASKVRAFFPGYLFTHIDPDAVGMSVLQWAPGSNGLVEFGGQPASVPDNFIYELKLRVAALRDAGLRRIEWQRGDTVWIAGGPFAGCEAVFDLMLDDRERAQVFIHWLGQRVKMQLNVNAISKQRAG